MARFLSPEWLEDLDRAVRASTSLPELTREVRVVVEQTVTRPDADPLVYHVELDHGSASVRPGPATDPTVTFSQSVEVARGIATGTDSAQRAFMTGQMRVGGDLRALLAHQDVLNELGDVFATVRSSTQFETAEA